MANTHNNSSENSETSSLSGNHSRYPSDTNQNYQDSKMNQSKESYRDVDDQQKRDIGESNKVAQFDIVSSDGKSYEVTDERLDHALHLNEIAAEGKMIKQKKKIPLDQRIQRASLVPVDDDPRSMSKNENINGDTVSFTDEDAGDIQFDDEESEDQERDHQIEVVQVEPPTTHEGWVVNALKMIHSDLQQIKPLAIMIPIIKKEVDSLQKITAEMSTNIVEVNNTLRNMEKTITQNRIEIAKLTDLLKTISGGVQAPLYTAPSTSERSTPIPITKRDTNIDKFLISVSKNKNLSPDQEIILRNMLLIKDKEIIITTMKSLGSSRELLDHELDVLLQLDTGSQKSMKEAYQIVMNLIPIKESFINPCDIDCPGPSSLPPSAKKVINPFKLKQKF